MHFDMLDSDHWSWMWIHSGDVEKIESVVKSPGCETVLQGLPDGGWSLSMENTIWVNVDAIVAADPDARWILFLGPNATVPNECVVHLGGFTGTVRGRHVNAVPVVPIVGATPADLTFAAAVNELLNPAL